jgi:hypothetical protein
VEAAALLDHQGAAGGGIASASVLTGPASPFGRDAGLAQQVAEGLTPQGEVLALGEGRLEVGVVEAGEGSTGQREDAGGPLGRQSGASRLAAGRPRSP